MQNEVIDLTEVVSDRNDDETVKLDEDVLLTEDEMEESEAASVVNEDVENSCGAMMNEGVSDDSSDDFCEEMIMNWQVLKAKIGAGDISNGLQVSGVSCVRSDLVKSRRSERKEVGWKNDEKMQGLADKKGGEECPYVEVMDFSMDAEENGEENGDSYHDSDERHMKKGTMDLSKADWANKNEKSDNHDNHDACNVLEKKERALVWGGEASAEDVREIKKMIRTGTGIYGHWSCKLELRDSLLENAGRGVFLKEGYTLYNGECITQYSGKIIKSTRNLSVEEQLRTIETDCVKVVGTKHLKEGDGFGSFVNSSVSGRTISFCRFVSYNNAVYMMASYAKEQYTLRGRIELYLTAGHAWWSLYNSTKFK